MDGTIGPNWVLKTGAQIRAVRRASRGPGAAIWSIENLLDRHSSWPWHCYNPCTASGSRQ